MSTYANVSMQQDQNKLVQLLGFIFAARHDISTLEANNSCILNWHIDAAHTAHQGMKSYTGLIFTIGEGSIASSSTEQKVDARSSTKSKLKGSDDCISKVAQTENFQKKRIIKLNSI